MRLYKNNYIVYPIIDMGHEVVFPSYHHLRHLFVCNLNADKLLLWNLNPNQKDGVAIYVFQDPNLPSKYSIKKTILIINQKIKTASPK